MINKSKWNLALQLKTQSCHPSKVLYIKKLIPLLFMANPNLVKKEDIISA